MEEHVTHSGRNYPWWELLLTSQTFFSFQEKNPQRDTPLSFHVNYVKVVSLLTRSTVDSPHSSLQDEKPSTVTFECNTQPH